MYISLKRPLQKNYFILFRKSENNFLINYYLVYCKNYQKTPKKFFLGIKLILKPIFSKNLLI